MAKKRQVTHRKLVNESNEDSLRKMLLEKREELKNFRFGISGSKIKDVKSAREIKREIARILTKLNNK